MQTIAEAEKRRALLDAGALSLIWTAVITCLFGQVTTIIVTGVITC